MWWEFASGMRPARTKVSAAADRADYHSLSRVVDRRFILGDAEKEMFVQFLQEYERLCGVPVLNLWCDVQSPSCAGGGAGPRRDPAAA